MTAQIIDGKLSAERLRAEVKQGAEAFLQRYGRKPGLEVVIVGDDPASHVYVNSKEKQSGLVGIRGLVHRLAANTTQRELLDKVALLNADASVDGILVQLPLPKGLNTEEVVHSIDPRKDVDGLHPVNAGLLASGGQGLRPCTPSGCMRLIAETGTKLSGKRALVVGRSNLVGKPIAFMLLEQNATVTLAHSKTQDLAAHVAESDVVIAAVGVPELIQGAWIKPGAVVIDVGMNRLADKRLVGDVQYATAAERAGFITPVPGGVGPTTIAFLLANTLQATERRAKAELPHST
jgi:methylenetetrahydrofolate dehydrogenase (NADP+)/methenyltetrahydrofolate cyclohydrolase